MLSHLFDLLLTSLLGSKLRSISSSEWLEGQVLKERQASSVPEQDVGSALHLLHPLDGALDYVGKAPTGIRSKA